MGAKRVIGGLVLLGVAGLVALAVANTPYDPPAWTSDEVRRQVDVLNEAAAVTVPHHSLGQDIRAGHAELFGKVEAGAALTEEESAAYRRLYQDILKSNQSFLARFDRQLTVLTDVGAEQANNVGGRGVPGAHDHHDVSAARNVERLQASLSAVEAASDPLTRIVRAARAYKDFTDIMLHLGTAPHTVSVVRAPAAPPPGDALAADFEAVMQGFKAAQFAPVNSPAYRAGLHAALDAYDRMALAVQARIRSRLGPVERTLAGRWLAWQSLTPPLGGYRADRMPRNP